MTAEVTYLGGLRTECRHLRSGNVILTDAPVDNRGQGQAFSPTDLIATALGNCMLTIMGIAGLDHNIDLEGARATVNKVMGANPRRIIRIEVTMYMPDKPYSQKEKKILERAAHLCPVKNSLHPDLEEVLEFVWLQ